MGFGMECQFKARPGLSGLLISLCGTFMLSPSTPVATAQSIHALAAGSKPVNVPNRPGGYTTDAGTGFADDLPVALAPVPGGSGGQILGSSDLLDRLLFVDPNGIIRYSDVTEIWYTADSLSSPSVVLAIGVMNSCCSGGRRLIAAAFPNEISQKQACYVMHSGPGSTVVSRLRGLLD